MAVAQAALPVTLCSQSEPAWTFLNIVAWKAVWIISILKNLQQWIGGNEADLLTFQRWKFPIFPLGILHWGWWVLSPKPRVNIHVFLTASRSLIHSLLPWLWTANLGLLHFCLGFPGQKYVHMCCVMACRINLMYPGCIKLIAHVWINHISHAQ